MIDNNNPTTNKAEVLECLTCSLAESYEALAGGYIKVISAEMLPPLSVLFLSFATLWVVIQGYKLTLGTTQLPDFFRELFFLCIAHVLLSVQSANLIVEIFETTMKLLGGASAAVLESSISELDATQNYTGLAKLVAVAETGLRTVIHVGWEIATSWSIGNMLSIIYAGLLIIPYFMLMIVYLSQTLVAVFRVMLVAAFFPFLMLCFGFKWGREMSFAGLKTLLSSIVVLFAASLALGVVMYGAASLGITDEGADVEAMVGWNKKEYILAVVLGWMGTAFMTEAVGLANSITGSALSNTSVGVLSAGMAGSAAMLAKGAMKSPTGAMNVAGYAAAAISGGGAGAKAAIGNRASALVDKYKSGYSGPPKAAA